MSKKLTRSRRAVLADKAMTVLFYSVGGFFLLLLVLIAGYIIYQGAVSFKWEYMAFDRNGIGNQLFNTVYLVFLSLLISVPLGIATGIYMAEYAKEGKLKKFIRICIESLSSLPSIVIGLFGYMVFILMTGMSWNLFAGAMAVSILSIPLICTTTEDTLKSLPLEFRQGSMGLGATQWQTIVKVLVPASINRIVTGIILAAGRGFGEAAALLYTAGMSTHLNWSQWDITKETCPLNPFRSGQTLSLHIWAMRTDGALYENSKELANVSSALLVILVLSFSLLSRFLSRRLDKKLGGK